MCHYPVPDSAAVALPSPTLYHCLKLTSAKTDRGNPSREEKRFVTAAEVVQKCLGLLSESLGVYDHHEPLLPAKA